MIYFDNVLQLIGKTPLVRLNNGCDNGGPLLLAKLEFYNPGGSIKDRMAYHILKKAMDEGRLKPGDTVIDNTSGNTGVALAMVASVLGLKAVMTTPEKTSQEKVDLIKSFGAEVIVTPTEADHDDPEGHYMKAKLLAEENGWFHTEQYDNPNNVEAHYLTTGPEIWEDTNGRITHFVAGIGTGGTFSGSTRYLKEKKTDIKAIAVDPEGSIFADYVREKKLIEPRNYKVEGIGSDCVTGAFHPELVDEVITVSDQISFSVARAVSREEGLSVGGSSGAAIWAARKIARDLGDNAVIVVIIADSGMRYLSKCFNDEWMIQHGFQLHEK